MIKLFKPRLVSVCAVALLLAACAGGPTTGSSSTNRADSNYNKSRTHSNDIWERVRNGYAMPNLYNDEVTAKENYYAQRADYVGRMANRSGDFMYIIMNEVERRKMPSEIALLPFVESAFVTTAQSPVKAAGLWQFMPATGRDFSLQQNHFADQRNDVVASTDAALTFLQRLYNQFGDWQLALAAYNWGPGNVTKAVRRAQANGLAGTYADIKMPLETRQYVPKLQAIKNIVNNPAQYGISLPNISNNLRHEAVLVTRDIDLAKAASLSGLDIDSFKRINPAFKKPVIVASLGSKILVPANRADDVRSALRDTSQNLASITTYSTYNTESLDDIASKFNTDANNLRYLNNIPTHHYYVKAGSAILVPRTSNKNSQDIPYDALTAGLSTTTGGVGLSNGNYIEQPTIVVQNTDEKTRQERSGIINPFTVSNTNNGPGLVVSNNTNDDDLGLLIKNNNALNDPTPASNALIAAPVRIATPATPLISTPPQPIIVNPQPLIVQAAEPTAPVIIPTAPVEPVTNVATAPIENKIDTSTATTITAATPISTPINTVTDTPVPTAAVEPDNNPALKPLVALVEDPPEVIAPLATPVVQVKKPVVKAPEPKPVVKLAQTSKPKVEVVKVNATQKSKAQLIPTEVKNNRTKSTKSAPEKTVPTKAASGKINPKPVIKVQEKVAAKNNTKTTKVTAEKPIAKSAAKTSTKATEKVTVKATANKPVPKDNKPKTNVKEAVSNNNKNKKVVKK